MVCLLKQALHFLDMLDFVQLRGRAVKLELIGSCGVSQVHPEHISLPGYVSVNQPEPRNTLPNW